MSLTLTYDGTLSRVRVAAAGLTAPTGVQVQRSTDQITWTTVRGGADTTPVAGAVQVDDYEFAPDVPNYYRIVGPSKWDAFGRTVASGWGTADSGQAWTVLGGPAADYLVTAGSGRHSHSTINIYRRSLLAGVGADVEVVRDVTLPAAATGAAVVTGTLLRWSDSSNFYWLRTEFNATGGAVMAKITKRVAGVDTELAVANPVPSLTYSAGVPLRSRARIVGTRLYLRIWPAASPEPVDWTLTAADASLTAAAQVGEQTWVVSGNTNPLPVVVQHDNWALTLPVSVLESDDITPMIGGVWLKSIARPFLNRQVVVMDYSDIERSSRAGVFDVIGRSYPVAVNDVRGSRRWTLEVLTQTADEADMDLILASGDPLFVQVPADCDVPGGYVTVGDTNQRRTARRTNRRVFALPCVEVAPPGPDVVGATVNWQTVLSTYPTWADLLAAHPTWQDLLELIGSPTDVVVP